MALILSSMNGTLKIWAIFTPDLRLISLFLSLEFALHPTKKVEREFFEKAAINIYLYFIYINALFSFKVLFLFNNK